MSTTNTADLRQHAMKLLAPSKKFFAEDGDLDATAFIITADEQLLRPIELEDELSKVESCKKIIGEARKQNALAIITVFLARSADYLDKDFDQEGYSWGDIQHSRNRSILVTVSGPGIKSWAAALPFTSTGRKVNFSDLVEFGDGVDLGLFPGWSEQTPSPKAS